MTLTRSTSIRLWGDDRCLIPGQRHAAAPVEVVMNYRPTWRSCKPVAMDALNGP